MPATILCACLVATRAVAQPLTAPAPVQATFVPDAAAPALDFSKAWCPRWVPANHEIRGTIVAIESPASTLGVKFTRLPRTRSPHDETDWDALAALFPDTPRPTWETEGLNATPVEVVRKKPAFQRCGEPDASMVFRFISGRIVRDAPTIAIDRTTFALYDCTGEPATHLVVLLPGMFGTPEQVIEPLIAHLRTHSCAVLRMISHPARMTETLSVAVNPDEHASIESAAEQMADAVNQRLAECAYSVEAALHHVTRDKPALEKLPLVGIGASGGGIMMPTVTGLHPERWAGAIIIGGGVDFWLINQRSNYQNLINALKVEWVHPPSSLQDQTLDQLYLAQAHLDPFHTAPSLRATPTLIIRGENDRAVPAALGALLAQRIASTSKDSREIATPLTHEALFGTLPARFDEITDFVRSRRNR